MTKPIFLHIQHVSSLKKVERWPGCGLAIICRLSLALIGGILAGATIAYDQQVFYLPMAADTIHAAGIIGGLLCTASLLLPSRWCRKFVESFIP